MRILCWLAVVAQIFAPLSGVLHHALVAHHFCLEHGVDEHSPANTSPNALDARSAADCVASSIPSNTPEKHDSTPHERCEQPFHLHIAQPAPQSNAIAWVGTVAAPLPRVVTRERPASIPLLRLAPKTPPPHFA